MSNFRIEYSHPWLLLAIIPILLLAFIPHFITPKKYRRTRNRIISLVMFLVASILSVNLLAGVSFAYETPNIKNEVIILVDVSESGDTARADKDSFVKSIINVADGEYNVGVVKFGYDQKYVAELSSNPEELLTKYIESDDPDTSAADIASVPDAAFSARSASGSITVLPGSSIRMMICGSSSGAPLRILRRGGILSTIVFSVARIFEVEPFE